LPVPAVLRQLWQHITSAMASMLNGLFGSVCTVDITLDAEPNRKTAPLSRDKKGERAYIYTDGEDVSGSAVVSVRPGKKLDHQGIKVELIGQVDMMYDKSKSYDFFFHHQGS